MQLQEQLLPLLRMIWRLFLLMLLTMVAFGIGLLPILAGDAHPGWLPSLVDPFEAALSVVGAGELLAAIYIPRIALRGRLLKLPGHGPDSDRELLKLYFPALALRLAFFLGIAATGLIASITSSKPHMILPFAAVAAAGILLNRPCRGSVLAMTGRSLT